MHDDTSALFAHLHRGGGYAYFHALPDRKSWWYPTNQPLVPPDVCESNWYFGVHPTTIIPPTNAYGEPRISTYVRSQKRYIAAINCLYGEYDEKDYGSKAAILGYLAEAPFPYPSVVIDSGGGIHCYWLLQTPFIIENEDRREAARIIQYLWVDTVASDPGARDLTRVLRVPGTMNLKYDPPRPVKYIIYTLHAYTLTDLTKHLPAVREAPPRFPVEDRRNVQTIEEYNTQTNIGSILERYGYHWRGTRRMVSPHSGSKRDGVVIDTSSNRAYVHTGGDPLSDGYWKKPFDVLCILEYGGDFKRAVAAIRGRS